MVGFPAFITQPHQRTSLRKLGFTPEQITHVIALCTCYRMGWYQQAPEEDRRWHLLQVALPPGQDRAAGAPALFSRSAEGIAGVLLWFTCLAQLGEDCQTWPSGAFLRGLDQLLRLTCLAPPGWEQPSIGKRRQGKEAAMFCSKPNRLPQTQREEPLFPLLLHPFRRHRHA